MPVDTPIPEPEKLNRTVPKRMLREKVKATLFSLCLN